MCHLVLVGLGPHARQKHLPLIGKAIQTGAIRSFEVLELESARDFVESALRQLPVRASRVIYMPDRRSLGCWYEKLADDVLDGIRNDYPDIRIVLSTEPKAHFGYLSWCATRDVPCLVDKPIITPVGPGGDFQPRLLDEQFESLVRRFERGRFMPSVMTARRHYIEYETARKLAKYYIEQFGCPITNISLYYRDGVWNLPEEFDAREDHPYKYGYGMIMHSGYHVVDILTRLLELNSAIGHSYVASADVNVQGMYPSDQIALNPEPVYGRFSDGYVPLQSFNGDGSRFGETDALINLKARNEETHRATTLVSAALLQTGPSIRDWMTLPSADYNRNGRFPIEELHLSIGFLLGIHVRIYSVPLIYDGPRTKFQTHSEITVFRNPGATGRSSYRRKTRTWSVPEAARSRLFNDWLADADSTSRLDTHRLSHRVFSVIANAADMERQQERKMTLGQAPTTTSLGQARVRFTRNRSH